MLNPLIMLACGPGPCAISAPILKNYLQAMPFTRRRDNTENLEQWSIWDGDVRVGVMRKVMATEGTMTWQWGCWGDETGNAGTFEEARAEFQRAWDRVAPTITEADRDAFRFQEAHTAWKYAMWDAGCRMPTQSPDGWSVCFCGARITAASSGTHIRAAHMTVKGRSNKPE